MSCRNLPCSEHHPLLPLAPFCAEGSCIPKLEWTTDHDDSNAGKVCHDRLEVAVTWSIVSIQTGL